MTEAFIRNLESYDKETLFQIIDYYGVSMPTRSTKKQLIHVIMQEATRESPESYVQPSEETKVSVRVARILESLNENI